MAMVYWHRLESTNMTSVIIRQQRKEEPNETDPEQNKQPKRGPVCFSFYGPMIVTSPFFLR